MKLEKLKEKTFESNDFVFEGIDAKINPEQMQKMMELFSSPYKDSISSVVREITSNCFDSHREAKVDDAVVITLDKDQSGEFIMFSDVGTGLSPERIENIYINYLSSTKEDSNDFIGAFGIGSKSPLSYRDMFFINTVYEGIRYEYIMRKGDTVPRIEKLNETPVDQRNGTDIKIYIKPDQPKNQDNYDLGDLGYFIKAIENQLKYFNNIYLDNKLSYLSHYFIKQNIDKINNFKLYEGEHFIARSGSNSSFEMCLGSVYYPIDYKIVFPGLTRMIDLPIALKFDIGDLMVTFSREDVKYNADTISKIRNKTRLAIEELINLYIDETKDNYKGHDDYLEYLKNLDRRNIKISKNGFEISLYDFMVNFTSNEVLERYPYSYIADIDMPNGYFTLIKDKVKFNIKDSLSKYIGDFEFELPKTHYKPFLGENIRLNSSVYGTLFEVKHFKSKNNISFSPPKTAKESVNRTFASLGSDSRVLVFADKDVKVDVKIKTYIESEIVKDQRKDIVIFQSKRSLKAYKYIMGDSYKDKGEWRDIIKLIQNNVEKNIIDNSIKLSDIEKKATKEWYNSYKKKNGLDTVKQKVTKDPEIINVRERYGTFTISHLISDRPIHEHLLQNNDFDIKRYKDNIKAKKQHTKVLFTTRDDDFSLPFKKFTKLHDAFSLKDHSEYDVKIVSKVNKKMIDDEKLNYSVDEYINDNIEDIIDIYLYTKYIKENKDYFNKLIENNGKYIDRPEVEASLAIYDLFTNKDLYGKNLKNKSILSNIEYYLNKELTENTQKDSVFDHIDRFNETYEKLFNELLSKSNLKNKFDKKCKERCSTIEKNLKNYKDFLDKEYEDLYIIERLNVYEHQRLTNIRKYINLDMGIAENKLMVKDSVFYKLKEFIKKGSNLDDQTIIDHFKLLIKNKPYEHSLSDKIKIINEDDYYFRVGRGNSNFMSLYISYLVNNK